jgi:hypothetical protein
MLLIYHDSSMLRAHPVDEKIKRGLALSDREGVYLSQNGKILMLRNTWISKERVDPNELIGCYKINDEGRFTFHSYSSELTLPEVFIEEWDDKFHNSGTRITQKFFFYGSPVFYDLNTGKRFESALNLELDAFDTDWILQNGKNKHYVTAIFPEPFTNTRSILVRNNKDGVMNYWEQKDGNSFVYQFPAVPEEVYSTFQGKIYAFNTDHNS